MSLYSVEIRRCKDSLRAGCIIAVDKDRGEDREGKKWKNFNAKMYQASCWNGRKCDLIFIMKETIEC